MGKVFQKLALLASVQSITFDAAAMATITLASGYSNGGKDVLVCKTAHEARLWIQAATNGNVIPMRRRAAAVVTGEVVDEPAVTPYAGLGPDYKKPIWELPKGFNRPAVEGRDAFLRGFARNSHPYGETLSGREFEAAWKLADANFRVRLAA